MTDESAADGSGRPDVERRASNDDGRSDAPEADDANVSYTRGDPANDAGSAGDDPLARIESKLDRAGDVEPDAAASLLRSAREELDDVADSISDSEAQRLRTQIDRQLAAFEESDQYSALLGSSMDPEDDTAP